MDHLWGFPPVWQLYSTPFVQYTTIPPLHMSLSDVFISNPVHAAQSQGKSHPWCF